MSVKEMNNCPETAKRVKSLKEDITALVIKYDDMSELEQSQGNKLYDMLDRLESIVRCERNGSKSERSESN